MESFLKSDVVKMALLNDGLKCKALTMGEILEFFKADDVFDCGDPKSQISIEKFSRVFLPKQSQVETYQKPEYKLNLGTDESQLIERLTKLDERIRQKFGSKWQYVRRAFLDLDKDGNGTISFEEILALFSTEAVKVEPGDLRLLLQIKDSSGKGQLSYSEFCIWLG